MTDESGGKPTAVMESLHRGHLTPNGRFYLASETTQIGEKEIDGRSRRIYHTQLKAWPFDDMKNPRVLWEHEWSDITTDGVRSFAISPDGSRAALACNKAGIRVIDLATGELLHQCQIPDGYVTSVAFSRDGRLLVGGDYPFHVWNVETGERLWTFTPTSGDREGLFDTGELSPDNRLLALGDRGGRVTLKDLASGRTMVTLKGHGGTVRDLEFSPDGKLLASCADDATILVWSLDPEDWPSSEEEAAEMDALWEKLGELDAAIAYDTARQMIDRSDEALAMLQKKIDRDVKLPEVWLLETKIDLRFWRAAYVLEQIPGDEARKLREHIRRPLPDDGKNPFGEEFAEHHVVDGERVTSPSGNVSLQRLNHQLCLCDPDSGEPRKTLPVAGRVAKLSSDGRFVLLSLDNESYLTCYELATATRLWLTRTNAAREPITLHSDGRHMMIEIDWPRDQIQTWDLLTGENTANWETKDGRRNGRVSPDGRRSFSFRNNEVTVYEGNRKKLWSAPISNVHGTCEFVSDSLIAISSRDLRQIALHRADDGRIVDTISLGEGTKLYAVSPFGQTAVGKDSEGKVRLYELTSGQPVQEIPARNVIAAAYDGNRLLTLDDQKATRVWALDGAATRRGDGESIEDFHARLAEDFSGDDGAQAYRATWALIDAGNAGVAALRAHTAKRSSDTKKIRDLIQQLNDDEFRTREKATRRLIDMGPEAARLLAASPLLESSPEVKQRATKVFEALANGRSARLNRLRWVLTEINTSAARMMADEMRLPDNSLKDPAH